MSVRFSEPEKSTSTNRETSYHKKKFSLRALSIRLDDDEEKEKKGQQSQAVINSKRNSRMFKKNAASGAHKGSMMNSISEKYDETDSRMLPETGSTFDRVEAIRKSIHINKNSKNNINSSSGRLDKSHISVKDLRNIKEEMETCLAGMKRMEKSVKATIRHVDAVINPGKRSYCRNLKNFEKRQSDSDNPLPMMWNVKNHRSSSNDSNISIASSDFKFKKKSVIRHTKSSFVPRGSIRVQTCTQENTEPFVPLLDVEDEENENSTDTEKGSGFLSQLFTKKNSSSVTIDNSNSNIYNSDNESLKNSLEVQPTFEMPPTLTEKKDSMRPMATSLADVVSIMKEGRLVRLQRQCDDTSRIIDTKSTSRSHLSFTSKPHPLIMLPMDPYRIYWDLFISLLLAYYAIVIPISLGFNIQFPIILEFIFTSIFFFDIGLQFCTAFEVQDGPQKGWIEVRPRYIARHYLQGWFLIDFISTIPFDVLSVGQILMLLRLGKLLRILRLGRIFTRIFQFWRTHPSIVRLITYLIYSAMCLHWMACGFWSISSMTQFEDNWSFSNNFPEQRIDALTDIFQYFNALLWAIWVSTGTGKTEHPTDELQAAYTILSTLTGFVGYAFIVGCATSALSDMDASTSWKRKRITQMKQFLEQRHVSDDLVKEILAYYEYRWARNLDTSDDLDLFRGLHGSLKRTLLFAINQPLILKVPMFGDITEPCLEALIHCLIPRIYLPGEWVLMKGERGDEMYFIVRGKFEVVPNINEPPVAVLINGQSFGELALLSKQRRNSSVKSVCHGEVMCLHITDFEDILEEFPIFAITLEKWAPHVRLSRGWDKIRHAVRLMQAFAAIGLHQSFSSMMRDFNNMKKQADTPKARITGFPIFSKGMSVNKGNHGNLKELQCTNLSKRMSKKALNRGSVVPNTSFASDGSRAARNSNVPRPSIFAMFGNTLVGKNK